MSKSFRGVFTVLSTPFNERLEVDWEGLRRTVDFCIECGAHGLVWPVIASSFTTLTDEERLKGTSVVVEQAAGRIPVLIGTQGVSKQHAMIFSQRANEIGANAVIAMAPYIQKLEDEEAFLEYYQGISSVVDIPIFIQDHEMSGTLPVSTLVRLIQEVEHIEYIKEESMPVTHRLTQILDKAPRKLKGVFGGMGGHFMLLEFPRGVAGLMPGCDIPDVIVRIWNALEAGDIEKAKRIHRLLSPLFVLEASGVGGFMEILRRRGILKDVYQRVGKATIMDEYDRRALDDILRDMESLFTCHPPLKKIKQPRKS
jgi:4-hydroxy-tetrahydrodipicolinate synthase